MLKRILWSLMALGLVSGVGLVGCGTPEPQEVSIAFKAMIGDKAAACGETYEKFGTGSSSVELVDLRFYVSNVRLVTEDDKEVPVTLKADGKWQDSKVTLLDFENGTGKCADKGTKDTNLKVVGTATPGTYKGIRFDIGVPFDVNHNDPAKASAPLNVLPLHWSWLGGYKFVRIDLKSSKFDKNYLFHLGSTGCKEDDNKKVTACSEGNRPSIELMGGDPTQKTVVLDVAKLLKSNNTDSPTPNTAPGCMSGQKDPDCKGIFTSLGLKHSDNSAGAQSAFSLQ